MTTEAPLMQPFDDEDELEPPSAKDAIKVGRIVRDQHLEIKQLRADKEAMMTAVRWMVECEDDLDKFWSAWAKLSGIFIALEARGRQRN